jgi:hypothetical protein
MGFSDGAVGADAEMSAMRGGLYRAVYRRGDFRFYRAVDSGFDDCALRGVAVVFADPIWAVAK